MKKSIPLALITLLFFVACQKEEDCVEIEQYHSLLGEPLFEAQYPSYSNPHFNPNNPNEFLCFYAETAPPFDLVKYNMETQVLEVIMEAPNATFPRWGKKDWIVFSLFNGAGNDGFNIWKIKSNGDSLTQLTFTGNCFRPGWDITGEKLIYDFAFTSPSRNIIIDKQGTFIDTTFVGIGSGSWQHDSLIVHGGSIGLRISNPYPISFFHEKITGDEYDVANTRSGGADWINDQEAVWCNTSGVYKTNVVTKETVLLKETCFSDYFIGPTYAPSAGQVLLKRRRWVEEGEIGGIQFAELYLMDLETGELEKIEF